MTQEISSRIFIKQGKPVGLLGGTDDRFKQEGDAFVVLPDERWGNPLFADACLDEADFHIHARLTVDRLAGTGVSMLLGGHYHYNWSRPEGNLAFRICLDEDIHPARKALDKTMYIVHGRTDPHKPWSMRENLHEKQIVGPARDFFLPGQPFTIDLHRRGLELQCLINDREAFRTNLGDDSRISPGRCGDAGWPISVGFLPALGKLRLHDFHAQGQFPGPIFPASDAWHHNTDGYACYRIPSLCVSPSGRLMAFAEARRSYLTRGWQWHATKGTEILSGELHCAIKTSDDEGRTWSTQHIIPQLRRGTTYQARDPSPLVDIHTRQIFLFTRGPWMVCSQDDGQTWSSPQSLAHALPNDWDTLTPGVGNSSVQLQRGKHKGRLILALYTRGITALILSDDHGQSWFPGAMMASGNTMEPSILECDDGRVLVSPRHGLGSAKGRLFLTSSDGGQSFCDKRYEPALPMAGQGEILAGHPLQTQSAGVVRPLFCCGPADKKTRLAVATSLDDGQTWPHLQVIDHGSAANLALVALNDQEIGVLYERDKYRRLTFQRVRVDKLINAANIET